MAKKIQIYNISFIYIICINSINNFQIINYNIKIIKSNDKYINNFNNKLKYLYD